jgi:4-hydroxy-4-methyl-2-oxoglutarate aldolase
MNPLVQRLSSLDSCAVSDALDRAEINGVILGLSQLSTNRRIVGEAITVQLAPYEGRPAERHLCTAAVEVGGPGKIIVIAHNGRMDAAGWGGVLSLAAVTRKIEGIVIDGACRDLDESRELGLPVYGKNAVPITARGRVIECGWNVAVVVGGTRVAPGDLVIADASGIAVIPAAQASTIVTFAETIAQRELLMAADLRAGKQVSAVMGATYETMLR